MKNKKILSCIVYILLATVLVTPVLMQASEGGDPGSPEGGDGPSKTGTTIKIENPFKQNTIEQLIETLIRDIFIPIGGVLAVLMVMWAGFLYVTARGDTTKIKKAHDALLWAVIGAGILLGAWAISEAVGTTINKLKG